MEVWLTHNLATLAEACAKAGRLDEGLKAIDEALHLSQQSGECFWEAEIYRVRGELLLKQKESNRDEAQTSFERAIQIARAQTAKSLELRATTNLARLLRDTKRRTRQARCSPASTAGSPRALTPPTSRMRRRY